MDPKGWFPDDFSMAFSRNRESGQAAVESAIVLPLQIFFALGILQLTMMQHAKLMTEYAAYQAARAGIVWNGNNERMKDAAIIALLPTLGQTNNIGNLGLTYGKQILYDTALRALSWGGAPSALNGSNLLGRVRVDTINPSWMSGIGSIWKIQAAGWKEIDFDGADNYPDMTGLGSFIRGFVDPNWKGDDDKEGQHRAATVLSIRVRLWYELHVPFANYIIFTSWFAANATKNWTYGDLRGSIYAPTMGGNGNAVTISSLPSIAGAPGIDHQKGYNTVYPLEMTVLWGLAKGSLPFGISSITGQHYFVPISATHSMRMQSNFHRKWLMHVGDWDSSPP